MVKKNTVGARRMLPRSVPWQDWTEWEFVKSTLLLDPPSDLTRAGLEVANLWRIRGRVPHSVESTAQLVEIKMLDASGSRGEMELRLQYSLVIIRAVNGLVDTSQQGVFADSIFSIAQSIGLPGWIVELRHDATHNQLPTLSVLRSAANQLIYWYHENYWQMQSRHLESLTLACTPTVSAVTDLTLESMLTGPDASSTNTCELFLPLFFTAIMTQVENISTAGTLRAQAKQIKSPASSIQKLFNRQRVQWWPRLSHIAKISECFVEQFLCRLFAYALTCSDDTTPNNESLAERCIALCDLWILAICNSKLGKIHSVSGRGEDKSSSSGIGGINTSKKLTSSIRATPTHGCWTALSRRVDVKLVNERQKGSTKVVSGSLVALEALRDHICSHYLKLESTANTGVTEFEDTQDTSVNIKGGVDGDCDDDEDDEDDDEDEDDLVEVDADKQDPNPILAKPEDHLESFEMLIGIRNSSRVDENTKIKRQRRDLAWTKLEEKIHWPMGLVPGRGIDSQLYSLQSKILVK